MESPAEKKGMRMSKRKFLALSGFGTAAFLCCRRACAAESSKIFAENKPGGKELDMQKKHKCKITVLRRECFKDLQEKYLADPKSGPCPYFRDGQEIVVDSDNFFRMLNGTFCAEAWDCISRYVYAALQGGSIMRGWTNDEKVMIASCNDGTRPVIFKLERIDE